MIVRVKFGPAPPFVQSKVGVGAALAPPAGERHQRQRQQCRRRRPLPVAGNLHHNTLQNVHIRSPTGGRGGPSAAKCAWSDARLRRQRGYPCRNALELPFGSWCAPLRSRRPAPRFGLVPTKLERSCAKSTGTKNSGQSAQRINRACHNVSVEDARDCDPAARADAQGSLHIHISVCVFRPASPTQHWRESTGAVILVAKGGEG
jgi:hypothetical protein